MLSNHGPMTNSLISQADYARRKGWSRAYVSKLVKAGRITLVEGKIEPLRADAEIEASANPAYDSDNKVLSSAGNQKIDYLQARAMREHYNAETAKLDYEVKAGLLVDRAAVEGQAFNTARAVREALTQIPARICGLVVAIDDADEIEKLLEDEINSALENLIQAVPRDGYASASIG